MRKAGIEVHAFTDVKHYNTEPLPFLPLAQIQQPGQYFLRYLITKRGVGNQVINHFTSLGFIEGFDIIRLG